MIISFDINTNKRTELIDITSLVDGYIKKSEIRDGICIIFIPHTTAGITINENYDTSVKKDILNTLNKLVPENFNYTHSEGNSPAHIKASIVGSSAALFVEDSKLVFGTWQGIFFCEFDGPRKRKVHLKIIKG